MKKIYLSFVAAAIFATAQSQITLDQNDFPKAGFSREYYEVSGDSVDVGSAGANQTFDFSKTMSMVYDTFMVEIVDPASTSFGSQHPGTNFAFLYESDQDSATGQNVYENWVFGTSDASESSFDRVTIRIDTGALFHDDPPTTMIDLHLDYSPNYVFVSAANTYSSNNTFNGGWGVTLGALTHHETSSRQIEVDAYGTFINPWTSFDALRFKVIEINSGVDSVNGSFDDMWSDTMHYFEYWVKDLGYYIARAYTSDDYSFVWGVELAKQLGPVGVNSKSISSSVKVYPNPATDVIYLQNDYDKPVQFIVWDLQGKQVFTGRIAANQAAARIDVQQLQPGAYFVELFSDADPALKENIQFVKK